MYSIKVGYFRTAIHVFYTLSPSVVLKGYREPSDGYSRDMRIVHFRKPLIYGSRAKNCHFFKMWTIRMSQP